MIEIKILARSAGEGEAVLRSEELAMRGADFVCVQRQRRVEALRAVEHHRREIRDVRRM